MGEPYAYRYFEYSPNIDTYYQRRRTLFNIYGFAEHVSTRNATPELIIDGCEFEYFLGATYESLINVETYTMSRTTVQDYTYDSAGVGDSTPFYFYTYDGADRGAKITITNSDFKHSQFCKGMIVYRVMPLVTKSQSFLNMTDLYMTNTHLNKADSFILIKDSSFLNMNAFSMV